MFLLLLLPPETPQTAENSQSGNSRFGGKLPFLSKSGWLEAHSHRAAAGGWWGYDNGVGTVENEASG
ncbi:MAG: hypothetical protein ACTIDN_04265 [Acetobacter sp.]|uniref:hypothetical protein n=1 Tax=Acetobacter sp. TaxID=440 RepID=UPI003F920197